MKTILIICAILNCPNYLDYKDYMGLNTMEGYDLTSESATIEANKFADIDEAKEYYRMQRTSQCVVVIDGEIRDWRLKTTVEVVE